MATSDAGAALFDPSMATPFTPAAVAAALRRTYPARHTSRAGHIGRCFLTRAQAVRVGASLAAKAPDGQQFPAPRTGELFHPYPGDVSSVIWTALRTESVPAADLFGPLRNASPADMLDQPYFSGGYISALMAFAQDGPKLGFRKTTVDWCLKWAQRTCFLTEVIFSAARGQAVDPNSVTPTNLRASAEIMLAPGSKMDTSGVDDIETLTGTPFLAAATISQTMLVRLWRASEHVACYLEGWFEGRHNP